jgi:hypothetical protein
LFDQSSDLEGFTTNQNYATLSQARRPDVDVTFPEIAQAIEDVVRKRFTGVNIVKVEVDEGRDHDGDLAFFVRIIFDAKPEDIEPARLTSITRHLRSRLFDMGEDRFPYTRFIARDEYTGAAA